MAPHSGTLAWKIPWTDEPGRLQSMGSLRVGHDWVTSLSLFTFPHWRRKWQPTPVFLPGESQGRGAWWAAVYGVAQSWTRMKRLSNMALNIQCVIEQTFLQRRHIDGQHLKRCSTLIIIREIQIKTIMRYLLTPTRMAIIKTPTDNNKSQRGCRKKESSYTVVGM